MLQNHKVKLHIFHIIIRYCDLPLELTVKRDLDIELPVKRDQRGVFPPLFIRQTIIELSYLEIELI